ncbi:MAG: selenium cofactor biosynthesis protein YqeC [Anaerolineales bacterium]
MNLAQALRLLPPPSFPSALAWERRPLTLALSGAGGKTSALFQLARQLSGSLFPAVLVTTTTHLGVWQTAGADRHLTVASRADLDSLEDTLPPGVTLVSGPPVDDRLTGLAADDLMWLHEMCRRRAIPLLIEADGARRRALKAPADYEPLIPACAESVVVLAGLLGLGQPPTEATVHRPEHFARLSRLKPEEAITAEAVTRVLLHPEGGLKGIPAGARRVALLNQADTPALQAVGGKIASALLGTYQAVVVAALQTEEVFSVYEQAAGIVLAAGGSSRFGQPKQLLLWRGKPFVRQAAENALAAGLAPVVVVSGAEAERIEAAVQDLPVKIVRNAAWQSGQSSSLRAGLAALPETAGAAIFLLADQPQVPPTLLRALVEAHRRGLPPILAPQVGGQRANPVLFDRLTFPALQELRGDVGGRALFSRFPLAYLPWHDESLLVDVDSPSDLGRLP